ncbi:hypothetical protein BJX70DRAFT_251168 [Aspergillus crustosus]
MASILPFNPILANGGFETGALFPWIAPEVTAVNVRTGEPAFAGDHYLEIQTAPGNRANRVYQVLHSLDTTTNYTVTAKVWGPEISYSNTCSAYFSTSDNSTAGLSASISIPGSEASQWLSVEGQFQPHDHRDVLTIRAGCTLSGASHTAHLFFDQITLIPSPVLDE